MEIIEDYHKDFSDRYYQAQAINKANKSRATNKTAKDKKKKLVNDIEFNEIVGGLFELLNEVNKYSKNNSRKNKRPLKPNRFDSEPYEKAHKKIKLNNEEFYEDVSQGQHYQNNTNEQIEVSSKIFSRGINPRMNIDNANNNHQYEKEEIKKDGKKPGLYRFKDEVEGDKELQLKNLNLLFRKETERPAEKPENMHEYMLATNANKLASGIKDLTQQPLFGSIPSMNFFAELLKQVPNISFDNNNYSHYRNTFTMLSELIEKNELFSENIELPTYKNPLLNNKSLSNILQNQLMNLGNLNKNQMFPFNSSIQNIRSNEKINENTDDNKFLAQRSLTTPFKRAGTHVAIAYYIFVTKNKNKFNDNKNTLECDPTYHARILREKKNPSTPPSNTKEHINANAPVTQEVENKNETLETIVEENKTNEKNVQEETFNSENIQKEEKNENEKEKENKNKNSEDNENEMQSQKPEENLKTNKSNQENSENEQRNKTEIKSEDPIIENNEKNTLFEQEDNKEINEASNNNMTSPGSQIFLSNNKETLVDDKKEKSKKKKTKFILDQSQEFHETNKDSLKFKIHLQKSDYHFEEGFHSIDEE